jgi:hypothetical protein
VVDLCGLRQGIRKEDFDRVALVGAVAASAGVEIATLFKLIELALRYQNRPPQQAVLAAPAISVDRFTYLFSADRHSLRVQNCNRLWSVSAYQKMDASVPTGRCRCVAPVGAGLAVPVAALAEFPELGHRPARRER